MSIKSAYKQRGFGLLETALITVVLGGALLSGFVWMKAKQQQSLSEHETALLHAADKALTGYAAAKFRLPCPDTTNDGLEDCGGGALKGRLPYRTLGLESSDPRVGPGRFAYIVYRGATADLAVAANRFSPHKWDGTAHGFSAITGSDLCEGLRLAALAAASTATAHVAGSSASRNVAYALASPGQLDADGDGNLFDGANVSDATGMDDPTRQMIPASYDDRVLARSFDELSDAAQCVALNSSLDGLALAVDVVDEVNDQKKWTVVTASVLTGVSVMQASVNGYKTFSAAKTIVNASVTASAASSLLAGAIASCAILVGCAEIPHATATLVAAGAAIIAGGAAVVANTAAIVAHTIAASLVLTAAIQAGVALADTHTDLSSSIDAAKQAYDSAKENAVKAAKLLSDAQAAVATVNASQSAAWDDLIATSHSEIDAFNAKTADTNDPGGSLTYTAYDAALTDMQSKAANLNQKKTDYLQAQAETTTATDLRNEAQSSLDQAQTTLNALNTNLSARILEIGLVAANNEISSQQAAVDKLTADLQTYNDALSAKLTAEAAALSLQTSAQTAYDKVRQKAIDDFKLSRSYTYTPTGCKDSKGNTITCDSKTVDVIRDSRPTITGKIDVFTTAYQNWYGKNLSLQNAQINYDKASAAEADTYNAWQNLLKVASGATPTGTEVLPWNDAGAVLQGADNKGAVR